MTAIKHIIITAVTVFFITVLFPAVSRHANAADETDVTADDLIYLTENFPPHNFEQDGHLMGASIEILQLIWEQIGSSRSVRDIRLMPWARAIKRLENEPNIVLFGMGYSLERSKKFHWVGPYYEHSLSLIAKTRDKIKVHHIDDVKGKTIVILRIGHRKEVYR